MAKCKVYGKELQHERLTHCSDQCLFANLWNSESISGFPIENWDDSDPWI